jgi:hypothetical protein
MMTNAITTNFDRNAMPTNLLTVPEWRTLAHHTGAADWKAAVRAWVRRKGGALVLRADGRLQSFTLRDGKISQRTYRPGQWEWEPIHRQSWVA